MFSVRLVVSASGNYCIAFSWKRTITTMGQWVA